jgi:hypothetical protein
VIRAEAFYTAPPDFGKCNAFGEGFAKMQWLGDVQVSDANRELDDWRFKLATDSERS